AAWAAPIESGSAIAAESAVLAMPPMTRRLSLARSVVAPHLLNTCSSRLRGLFIRAAAASAGSFCFSFMLTLSCHLCLSLSTDDVLTIIYYLSKQGRMLYNRTKF